jgi:hypothetical protein
MSSPSQTPSSNSPPVPLDQDWIEDELVPFLQRVFEGEKRTPREWNRQVLYARHNLDRIVSNLKHYFVHCQWSWECTMSHRRFTHCRKDTLCAPGILDIYAAVTITSTDGYIPGVLRGLSLHD